MVYITSKQAYDSMINHNMAAAIPEYSRIAESTYA